MEDFYSLINISIAGDNLFLHALYYLQLHFQVKFSKIFVYLECRELLMWYFWVE